MYRFIVTIHARPAQVQPGMQVDINGHAASTLAVPQATLAATPMACTFEDACDRLARLERMFCEPDGSFVWTSAATEPAWQLDGNLYDQQGRLSFIDLNGSCPADRFDQLLAAFDWPAAPLVFQLTRVGVLLEEAEFRRIAAAG